MTLSTTQIMTVEVLQLAHGNGLPLPTYETGGSAGLDLPAAIEEDLILVPGGRALVPTGLSIALPRSAEAQVRPRSGLAAHFGVTVLNSPGTIDSDYRGEIKVILINHGPDPFLITRGMRIAQLVIAPVARLEWQVVTALQASARGEDGFGSTGVDVRKARSSC